MALTLHDVIRSERETCNRTDVLSLPLVSPEHFDEETFVRAIISNLEWHRRVVYHVAHPGEQLEQSVPESESTCQRCTLSAEEAQDLLRVVQRQAEDMVEDVVEECCGTENSVAKQAKLHFLLISSRFGHQAFLQRATVACNLSLDERSEAQIDADFIEKAWRTTCHLAAGADAEIPPTPTVLAVGNLDGVRGYTGSRTIYVSSDISYGYLESKCRTFDLFTLLIHEFAYCKAQVDHNNVNHHSPLVQPRSEPRLYANRAPPIAPELGCTFERKLFLCRPTFYTVRHDAYLPMGLLQPLYDYLLGGGPEPLFPIDLSEAIGLHKRDDNPISLDVMSGAWFFE